MLAACVSGAQLSVSAAADVTVPDTAAVWNFAKFEGSAAVTAADKQTVSYDSLEIHLAEGDSVTDGGINWSHPCGTASDSTDVAGNNRFVKFTPEQSGTISVSFSGSMYASNKKPRLYIVEGDAQNASFSKNGSTIYVDAAAANSLATLTAALDAGKTYYIWPYCYTQSSCAFNVSREPLIKYRL